jgi:hypothetical protein
VLIGAGPSAVLVMKVAAGSVSPTLIAMGRVSSYGVYRRAWR